MLSRRKLSNFATFAACATSCNSAIHPAGLNPTFLRAPSRFLERGRIPSMHPVASEGVVAASARSVILAVYHDYTRKAAVRYVGYLAPWCHVSSLTVLCTPLAMVHFPCAILPPLGPEGVSYRDDAPRASHDSWSPISVIFLLRVDSRGKSRYFDRKNHRIDTAKKDNRCHYLFSLSFTYNLERRVFMNHLNDFY